eukprot:UN13525
MGQNERNFEILSSLIDKVEVNKIAKSSPNYQILQFIKL